MSRTQIVHIAVAAKYAVRAGVAAARLAWREALVEWPERLRADERWERERHLPIASRGPNPRYGYGFWDDDPQGVPIHYDWDGFPGYTFRHYAPPQSSRAEPPAEPRSAQPPSRA
jgi:hypothetical protein